MERRRQHLPRPDAAAPPGRLPRDQPARRAVRHHRPPDLLGRTEHRETSAIFVGEPTGSRPNLIGETIYFELPYSKVRANAADLFWQTPWPEDHRTWIAPDIYAPPAFEAFSRNEDPAMDAILALREQYPGP
jgi:hypothetical protein